MPVNLCFRIPRLLLAIALVAALANPRSIPAAEPAKPEPSAEEILGLARHVGWQMTGVIIEKLQPQPGRNYPGIAAWLKGYRELTKDIDPQTPPEKWPTLDADELATRNPDFWRAYYEIAPGDPGVMAWHAGLLLSGGESARALYVLVIAQQRPGVPKELQQAFNILASHAQRTLSKARGPLHEGIKLFDVGDYARAVKKYRQQLALWPQDGWAAYELGLALYYQQEIAAGRKPPRLGSMQINQGSPPSPEVAALYAQARRHDPFQYNAYQGADPEIVNQALAMFKECRPQWEKLSKADEVLDRQVVERFSTSCQEAGVDELALVARQVVVARRGRYSPTDLPFISTSLRRLAPGPPVEAVIKRLAEPGPLEFKQLVVPVSPKP
jgi:tetratricopeptide (TPR) repeat protein